MNDPRFVNFIDLLYQSKFQESVDFLNNIEQNTDQRDVIWVLVLDKLHPSVIHKLLVSNVSSTLKDFFITQIISGKHIFILEYLLLSGYVIETKYIDELKSLLVTLNERYPEAQHPFLKSTIYMSLKNLQTSIFNLEKKL